MVQLLWLTSRSTASGSGSIMPPLAATSLLLLTSSLPKPSFSASWYAIIWSVRDSNSGSMTLSRHCSERFDAVTEPEVSNCVAAGSR